MSEIPNIEFKSKIFVAGTLTKPLQVCISGGIPLIWALAVPITLLYATPLTNYPYIPGSSLRGKMRSLYERMRGEMTIHLKQGNQTIQIDRVQNLGEPLANGASFQAAGPSVDPTALAGKLFGVPVDKQKGEKPEDIVPQRLVVRDARLLNADALKNLKNTDMPLTEVKTEVAIDRITSKANPRQIERVPAGARFEFEFVLNIYGADDSEQYVKALFECMTLLQDDYLGGHGSRGYGRIKFDVTSLTQKTASDYRNNQAAESFAVEIPESLRSATEPLA